MPMVSIIVPVYNAAKDLPRCLDSLFQQGFADWEAILVNDGSKDNSEAVLTLYAKRDKRFRAFSQKNAGPGAARNQGLALARGRYLYFCDADDCLPDDALQTLVDAIQGHDLAIGHFMLHDGNMVSRRGLQKKEMSVDRDRFLDLVIEWPGSFYYSALWNKLYKRSIVTQNNLRFTEGIIWGEDCRFNMQYYCYVQSARYVPKAVYHYYRKVTGLSWGSVLQLNKGVHIKKSIYHDLKHLYKQAGKHAQHRWKVRRYIFNVTLLD